ncbi:MAG: hypothetical protein Q9217_004815 [Psora testacea]
MSTSPTPNTPSFSTYQRHIPKRSRTEAVGRPLTLPRLLETLDAESLRGVLQQICTRHPTIAAEVEQTATRPSITSALAVLKQYEDTLRATFPFGGDHTSDYAYNRVRQPLLHLLDALADFVPHFLPPNETQSSQTLKFLDGATEMIHRLPEWQSFQNNLHKQNAYEEISKAWTLAIRETSKRAGGIQLKYEGWEQRVQKHNNAAGGRLQEALEELGRAVGWMGSGPAVIGQQQQQGDDISNFTVQVNGKVLKVYEGANDGTDDEQHGEDVLGENLDSGALHKTETPNISRRTWKPTMAPSAASRLSC